MNTDILVCSVAPGERSYFWPAIDNAERTTPVWYPSAHLAKTMPERDKYLLSYKFNYQAAMIGALIVVAIYFVTKNLK